MARYRYHCLSRKNSASFHGKFCLQQHFAKFWCPNYRCQSRRQCSSKYASIYKWTPHAYTLHDQLEYRRPPCGISPSEAADAAQAGSATVGQRSTLPGTSEQRIDTRPDSTAKAMYEMYVSTIALIVPACFQTLYVSAYSKSSGT